MCPSHRPLEKMTSTWPIYLQVLNSMIGGANKDLKAMPKTIYSITKTMRGQTKSNRASRKKRGEASMARGKAKECTSMLRLSTSKDRMSRMKMKMTKWGKVRHLQLTARTKRKETLRTDLTRSRTNRKLSRINRPYNIRSKLQLTRRGDSKRDTSTTTTKKKTKRSKSKIYHSTQCKEPRLAKP